MTKKETPQVETKPEISEAVLEMAKAIEAELTLDNKTGIVAAGEGIYEKTLPENLTIDTVKAVSTHNANFVAAGSYAVGSMAVAAMAKHKNLERVSSEIKMAGKDVLNVAVERSKDFVNHLKRDEKGEPEKSIRFGVVTTGYEVRAGKNAGELKKVRSAIADMAMAKLSK